MNSARTLVELGKSTTMPPVKPQRMALAVIISIWCAFSGYLKDVIVRRAVTVADVAAVVLTLMLMLMLL